MSEKQLESQEARSETSYVGGEEKEAILEWTPEEEKRIVRKFDTVGLPKGRVAGRGSGGQPDEAPGRGTRVARS